jgi:hypothetical protein
MEISFDNPASVPDPPGRFSGVARPEIGGGTVLVCG